MIYGIKLYKGIICFLLLNIAVFAQEFSKAIEDNSFLIEEAYNQDPRVVQHIFNVYRFPGKNENTFFTFTQEWPVGGQTNQLSYTIPWTGNNLFSGIGDILINYRYQLTEEGDFVWIAPRLSIILPTGNKDKNLGMGTTGIQFSFPVSKRISNYFAVHFNAGYTIFPGATDGTVKADIQTFNTGGSLIWLAAYNINFFVEYLFYYFNEFNGIGKTDYSTQQIINPGTRVAIDLGDLQIVPGISFPIRIDKDNTKTGFFIYLSFEHPF